MNPLFFVTVVLALLAYAGGYWLLPRLRLAGKFVAFGAAVLLAVPAVLLVVYYLHMFAEARWFYEWRTLPWSEVTAAGAGVLAGLLQGTLRTRRIAAIFALPAMLFLLLTAVTIPFAKGLFLAARTNPAKERWQEGVCIQSTPSTCGPASAATLARAQGLRMSEHALARASYTSISGTEVWYLARALRARGFTTRYVFLPHQPDHLVYPSIAGVRLGGIGGPGHFIAVLGEEQGQYLIADPMSGTARVGKGEFTRTYHFTGFFLVVERKG